MASSRTSRTSAVRSGRDKDLSASTSLDGAVARALAWIPVTKSKPRTFAPTVWHRLPPELKQPILEYVLAEEILAWRPKGLFPFCPKDAFQNLTENMQAFGYQYGGADIVVVLRRLKKRILNENVSVSAAYKKGSMAYTQQIALQRHVLQQRADAVEKMIDGVQD